MSIAIVGEAWGKDEDALKHPFVGASGATLFNMLDQTRVITLSEEDRELINQYWRSGVDSTTRNPYFNWCVWQNHSEVFVTNVFNLRPKPTNDVKNLCGSKADGIPGWPALQQGKYVRREYEPELDRLFRELNDRKPNLVIAFGATPAWALLRSSGIRSIRGAPAQSHLGLKVLPTYHPAAVMRDWSLRPTVLADLFKARRESAFPEVVRPRREIWVEPSIDDLDKFEELWYGSCSLLSIDIETKGNMITCIGFAPRTDVAIVVPFFDPTKPGKNYWETRDEEREAWIRVKRWCQGPIPKLFQNGLYDIHFLWRTMGIAVANARHDTMLLHHALQPELEKGLGFLGSIYTNEASWKFMRKGVDTIKRED